MDMNTHVPQPPWSQRQACIYIAVNTNAAGTNSSTNICIQTNANTTANMSTNTHTSTNINVGINHETIFWYSYS